MARLMRAPNRKKRVSLDALAGENTDTPLPPSDPDTERILRSRLKPEPDDPEWVQSNKGKRLCSRINEVPTDRQDRRSRR